MSAGDEDKVTEATFRDALFDGRRVIVSGGSSGIGLAIARGFAALGGDVIATGSSGTKLAAEAGAAVNAGIEFQRLDVQDQDAISAFMDEQSRIDVLVNAQGIARPETEWEEAGFSQVLDVNLTSVFRLTMTALSGLTAAGGAVVNFASMLSYLADAEVPAYTASKTGILGLTRAMAHRFGPQGVRVNAVAPGYHRTAMTRPLWSDPVASGRIADRSALKRWGEADDLAGATIFLASPAAAFVTGAVLPVDGGYHTG